MSFPSTFSDVPPGNRPGSVTLSEALYNLGFDGARTQNYDWMTAYPDALPLLDSLRTSLHPSSVLSETETQSLTSLDQRYEKVPPQHIIDTAQPLIDAPFVKKVGPTREALLNSARNRVKLLKTQRQVLLDALRQKREETTLTGMSRLAMHRISTSGKGLQLLSAIEVLKKFIQRDLENSRNEPEMIRFCEVEAKHCETIASVIIQSFRHDLKTRYDHQSSMTPRTKRAINIYAKLKDMQCMYRALVIRDAAMLASLGTNDGRHLEMTPSSMLSLIKELRTNSVKAMQLKAKQVSEKAREALLKNASIFSRSERVGQQDAYLDAMRQCISLYLEQRLRIHSLKTAANDMKTRRDHVLDLLKTVAPKNSSLSVNVDGVFSNAHVISEEDSQSDANKPCDTEDTNANYHVCNDDRASFADLENRVFTAHINSITSHISSVTRNAEQSGSWLQLSSHAQCDVLIKNLEDQLSKNTILLEALLQKKATIVERSSPSSQDGSPGLSWISRINGSHSPKVPSYTSSSSR